ncbi:MAG: ATP-binding cassette domain-containing protein [Deltaproteobacteria bacterium]|jgi:iron complex transport system ATP-binding protein|nr:ATP-binding cassette domain-containing protein [Deltaproteobacteria bacterium]
MGVIEVSGATLMRGGVKLIDGIDWRVEEGQNWALLGPNGAGKTLLLRLVTGYIWPTDGSISVLGHRLGEIDLRILRGRIGWVSQALADLTPGSATLREVVLSGPPASLGLYCDPGPADIERAEAIAKDFGLEPLLDRAFRLLSSGERQRALLARAAMAGPSLLILDEPMSNLDMGGREHFLSQTARMAASPESPAIILTTHNIQEIGPFITHAIVIKAGRVVAAGPLAETLTAETLGAAFDLPLRVERDSRGRYSAWLE